MSKENQESFAVGGQAVIEGVMMRAKDFIACAVRNPEGKIVLTKEPFQSFLVRIKLHKVPILRGAIGLIETMYVGMRMLSYSAEIAMPEEASKRSDWQEKASMGLTMILAFVLGIGLFFFVPQYLTDWTVQTDSGLIWNLVDGFFRLAIFLLYIWLISLWSEMRRVFEYHGAEHKTINAYESGKPMTPESILANTRLHPRCGTSFLLLVMVVSILVFVFLGKPITIGDRLMRLAFVPLIGGISYELIKLSGMPKWRPWLAPLVYPGLGLQLLTTKEPDLEQCEVALTSLAACLDPADAAARIPSFSEMKLDGEGEVDETPTEEVGE
ncbi:DUF1385 domain-containing protein [bacterium]|nr:DUF1385 domain-containing protein [bacterium]